MVQDINLSSQAFYPDFGVPNQAKDNVSGGSETGESFETAVKKAGRVELKKTEDSERPTKAPPRQVAKPKTDKPKVGNKDAFFPHREIPVHPKPVLSAAQSEPENEKVQSIQSNQSRQVRADGPQGRAARVQQALQTLQANGVGVRQLENPDGLTLEQVESLKEMLGDNPELNKEIIFDDTSGVMNQSVQNAQVSYPVRQIAAQSLDEDTKKSLMQQGLWNIQGSYLAQPTAKMLSMMEIQAQPLPVQKPIAQFMASMENELGVSPDRLVQAYSQLAPGQLSQSPQQTMMEVIKELDLAPADEKKAVQLYSRMLTQMQGGNELHARSVGPQQLQQLQAQSRVQDPAMESLLAQQKLGEERKGENELKPVARESNSMANQKYSHDLRVAGESVMGAGAVQGLQMNQMDVNDEQSGFQNFANQQNQQQQSVNEKGMSPKLESSAAKQIKVEDIKGEMPKVNVSNVNPVVSHGGVTNNFDSLATPVAGATGTDAAVSAGSGREARHEAIQSIINNAQALSQKGGGEMKMTLRPDHLGEIQLKVTTNGSQVDVQMVTERSEAKRLIEQNIHELKSGLAQHNLSMDRIEVSVGSSGGERPQNFQHHQGRPDFNQAREFAQQFNSQNQARQGRDFEEVTTGRPGAPKLRSMLNNSKMSAASLGQRASGRLNIVA